MGVAPAKAKTAPSARQLPKRAAKPKTAQAALPLPGLKPIAIKRERLRTGPVAPHQIVTVDDLEDARGDMTDRWPVDAMVWRGQPSRRPIVLAFDEGKTVGWARYAPGGYAGGHFPFAMDDACALLADAKRRGPAIVVIEDTHAQHNWQVVLELTRKVGNIGGWAEYLGLPYVRVLATRWQSAFFEKRPKTSEDGKRLSLLTARSLVSPTIVSDHQSDATLMGLYVRGL